MNPKRNDTHVPQKTVHGYFWLNMSRCTALPKFWRWAKRTAPRMGEPVPFPKAPRNRHRWPQALGNSTQQSGLAVSPHSGPIPQDPTEGLGSFRWFRRQNHPTELPLFRRAKAPRNRRTKGLANSIQHRWPRSLAERWPTGYSWPLGRVGPKLKP